jgi:hypothetical protein
MKTKLNVAASSGYLDRLVRRILCVFSPQWVEIGRGPLTQHLMFNGVKVGEQKATVIEEMNRCGKRRLLVDEGDGYKYEMPRERFYSSNASGEIPLEAKVKL